MSVDVTGNSAKCFHILGALQETSSSVTSSTFDATNVSINSIFTILDAYDGGNAEFIHVNVVICECDCDICVNVNT